MTLAAVWARTAAVDQYLLPAPMLWQTSCCLLAADDRTGEQTDGHPTVT